MRNGVRIWSAPPFQELTQPLLHTAALWLLLRCVLIKQAKAPPRKAVVARVLHTAAQSILEGGYLPPFAFKRDVENRVAAA
ncbi:MAG TPA: hypothetical protein VLM38_20745 [Blastocatellia bacterium]|nr:hypothetical protein [Blastocatellia bacterium]